MKLDIETTEDNTTNDGGFQPLPVGWYKCSISDCDETITKNGDTALKISFLLENGRRVNSYYNLWHSNPKAVEISTADVKALGRAVGLTSLSDTDQLMGKTLEVKLLPDGDFNTIKGYRSAELPLVNTSTPNGASHEAPPWAE